MNRRIVNAALAVMLCAAFLLPCMSETAYAWKADSVTYANADPERYTIVVDLTNKVVTVYERTDGDQYGSIARQCLCTIGADGTETPEGTWRLNDRRRRFGYFAEFDCYAQYWVNVVGGIYFHSILYTKPVEGYFTRASYNNIGNAASHGCIRLLVEDVRWIYYNCPPGTLVVSTKSKAADKELVESLQTEVSHREYTPEDDEYELASLSAPSGVARRGSVLTDSAGNYVAPIEKGETFEILLSGHPRTKVRLSGGEIGYLDNDRILFLDNSPDSIVSVIAADTGLYAAPNNTVDPLETLEKGTQVSILGSTQYFYKVDASGESGYVLKTRVKSESLVSEEDIESQLDTDEDSDEISFSVLRVTSEYADLYERATNRYDPIARFGEDTDLTVIGTTTSFYKVSVGGYTGYILKSCCGKFRITLTEGAKYVFQANELALPTVPEDE